MCELQPKLLAWFDGELAPDEAAAVERHVAACEDCRVQSAAFRKTSQAFNLYCDAVLSTHAKPKIPRWIPALAGAAGLAAAALLLAFARTRVQQPPPAPAPVAALNALPVSVPQPAPRKTLHRKHATPPVPRQVQQWQPVETVEIAIPAEAMFAPGALPEGLKFFADMSIAPDGSVRQVRLRQ